MTKLLTRRQLTNTAKRIEGLREIYFDSLSPEQWRAMRDTENTLKWLRGGD